MTGLNRVCNLLVALGASPTPRSRSSRASPRASRRPLADGEESRIELVDATTSRPIQRQGQARKVFGGYAHDMIDRENYATSGATERHTMTRPRIQPRPSEEPQDHGYGADILITAVFGYFKYWEGRAFRRIRPSARREHPFHQRRSSGALAQHDRRRNGAALRRGRGLVVPAQPRAAPGVGAKLQRRQGVRGGRLRHYGRGEYRCVLPRRDGAVLERGQHCPHPCARPQPGGRGGCVVNANTSSVPTRCPPG